MYWGEPGLASKASRQEGVSPRMVGSPSGPQQSCAKGKESHQLALWEVELGTLPVEGLQGGWTCQGWGFPFLL